MEEALPICSTITDAVAMQLLLENKFQMQDQL
jgi:hypothetical protein